MPDPIRTPGAVFLSYAREDAEAARRIAEALRGFGVEVWFDQNELRGGDSWDAKIRRQIRECALFVAIISGNTQARGEGYFRREWKLAVERTHDMSESRAFLVPILVDDHVTESAADVPEQFLKAQFTKLPGGEPTAQFVDQVKRLVQAPQAAPAAPARAATRTPQTPAGRRAPKKSPATLLVGGFLLAAAVVAAVFFLRPAAKPEPVPSAPPPVAPAAPAVAVDPKSIAVLPFVDMSQTKDQEYFSDGLAEELLNLLAKIPALHVTSRSSAFSFKGRNVELSEIAKRLNVANILEGSVRKAGNRVRITAQLIDARTDTHLWSETYDRSLDDIFAVQDEIAAAVVGQLKVSLLGAPAHRSKTFDAKAYALFLQARQLSRLGTVDGLAQAVTLYQQALAIDGSLAPAWDGLAYCYINQGANDVLTTEQGYRLAREAVSKALAIDPDLAIAYARMGNIARSADNDLAAAARHLEHAMALEPANTEIISEATLLARDLGRLDQDVAIREFVVAHDPVNVGGLAALGSAYVRAGRYDEGIAALESALRLSPNRLQAHYAIGKARLMKGDDKGSLSEFRQEVSESWRLDGTAMAYHALGLKAQSDAALAALEAKFEKDSSWNIAYICAFRGEPDQAFAWLEKAIAYKDSGLTDTAIEPLFANLHRDPRWLPFLRKVGQAPEQLAAIEFHVSVPK